METRYTRQLPVTTRDTNNDDATHNWATPTLHVAGHFRYDIIWWLKIQSFLAKYFKIPTFRSFESIDPLFLYLKECRSLKTYRINKMSLYPSLEDMKVDQMAKAQVATANASHALPAATASGPSSGPSSLYPSLDDYMGLHITEQMVRDNVPGYQVVPSSGNQLATVTSGVIAPVTGAQNIDVKRAEIKQGVREVILCKDSKGKVGLRVRHVNKGVFVSYVHRNSPAALVGLRFGDQILQIDGENVAGYEMDKVMKIIKKASPQRIVFAVRDRPFERTITLQKDSNGNVGFVFKDGKITAIAKDSSAARNGLLIEHNLVEVNGQNVVGLKDKEIKEIIAHGDRSVTLTIVPTFVFKHIMKNMSSSLVKGTMDHSIPDI